MADWRASDLRNHVSKHPLLHDVSSYDEEDSHLLNDLDDAISSYDLEGLALLRQIFPYDSTEELRKLHEKRLRFSRSQVNSWIPRSRLGRRLLEETVAEADGRPGAGQGNFLQLREQTLPDDFLRLPSDVAVRRLNNTSGRWEYQFVDELESRAISQHKRCLPLELPEGSFYSKVLHRDSMIGLGMTIVEDLGWVRVHAVRHGELKHASEHGSPGTVASPLLDARIKPGDILIGINGSALIASASLHESLVRYAVATLKKSPSPIVLHFARVDNSSLVPKMGSNRSSTANPIPSLLDDTLDSFATENSHQGNETDLKESTRYVPTSFASTLKKWGLLKSDPDVKRIEKKLHEFVERTRHWESNSCFCLDTRTFTLRPFYSSEVRKMLPFNGFLQSKDFPFYTPSVPVHTNYQVAPTDASTTTHSANPSLDNQSRFIPLLGVRRGLSVHIVNTFLDGDSTAYTIWVYDIDSGREWYAPIRYLKDFEDLRSATMALRPLIAKITFPTRGWSLFGSKESSESSAAREMKSQTLEAFLQKVCSLIYTDDIHPTIAEVAIHVQSFLGCDGALYNNKENILQIASGSFVADEINGLEHDGEQRSVRLELKRGIQIYVYRLFLLDTMRSLVHRFVVSTRARAPQIKEIERLQSQGPSALKNLAMEELKKIKSFLDQLQEMILEGCMGDFRSIAGHSAFSPIHRFFVNESYWERLVCEAVREQIEIEVYVPLRSLVSRLLVNGWRHEDMEVVFKIKELRKRPQGFFRISEEKRSISNWQSVSDVLKEGVSLSTLPCSKLRAIVGSASEISRLHRGESATRKSKSRGKTSGGAPNNDQVTLLGADEFLPIFIFCVVRAEIERPCALCVLLHALCDPINRIGEIGYYLASFEAAVTHIRELDLSEGIEDITGLAHVPLQNELIEED